jgi:CheY-like chemotaxis protein
MTVSHGPMTVLCVVNDLFFEAKLGEVLRTLGVPAAFAKSAEGLGKRLAATPRPALAIVDVQAKGLDGAEAIRTLAATGAPVIAYFSHVYAEEEERARAAGATEVMTKGELVKRLPDIAGNLPRAPLS